MLYIKIKLYVFILYTLQDNWPLLLAHEIKQFEIINSASLQSVNIVNVLYRLICDDQTNLLEAHSLNTVNHAELLYVCSYVSLTLQLKLTAVEAYSFNSTTLISTLITVYNHEYW